MRNTLLALSIAVLLAVVSGCCGACNRNHGSCSKAPETCRSCKDPGGKCAQPGAPASVVYPYYTTRGPRDFLATNPPSIGP